MTLEEKVAQGSRAQEILDNPVFNESFETVKQEIITQWENSPARDLEGREKLFLMLKLLSKTQQAIITVMETGKLAKEDLKYQQSLMDKAKELVGFN